MVSDALRERLHHHLPTLDLSARADGRVVVRVGGGVPDLVLDPSTVGALRPLVTPWGADAVRLVTRGDGGATATVMVLDGDVAFAPDPDAGQARVLPGRMRHQVADLPPVVGYHEMEKYLAAGAAPDVDGDRLLALALAAAACVAGAERVGLDVSSLAAPLDALIERARSY